MQVKRRFARWQINRECKIKLEGAVAFAQCVVTDISFMGFKVSFPFKLPKDAFLKLCLYLAEDCILEVETWIVWHKTIDGMNVYGFYFTRIRDQDKEKIYRFIRNYFPDEVNKRWWQDVPAEKGGDQMQDRRVFERFGISCPLRFLDATSNREGQAQTQNISAKGMRLVTPEELRPGTALELWLEIPDKGEPLYLRGQVVWTKPQALNAYHSGINLERAELMGLSRVLKTA